ncbi:undecaprenyl-diphosphate phosphatase [Candidatus Saccharibacteria bacterium]|nr:undecaprenyl-diphosphate phosphatase [Candidatus Saccharibacteria bacterium]
MEWLLIILAGLIQGVTEFIPVSSSGHLALLAALFDFADGFELYVLANIGTLGALIWFTRSQLGAMFARVAKGDYSLPAKLLAGILPAGLLGFFLTDFFKWLGDHLYLVVFMLVAVGAVMLFKPPPATDKAAEPAGIGWWKVIIIGLAQVLALIPGASRSGVTILAGLWTGLKQELAAHWSFLMSIPLVGGAVLKVLVSSDGAEFVSRQFGFVLVANLISFVVGLAAITVLMKVISKRSLKVFGIYRMFLGAVLLGLLLTGVL